TFADTVPDASTIWLFAETLKSENMERHLFDLYNEELFKQGIEVKRGCIMDSTFVEVPVQRNTREQNAQIKNGIVPAEFIENPYILNVNLLTLQGIPKNNRCPENIRSRRKKNWERAVNGVLYRNSET
ncbi:MAG: hypothetical protein LBU65_15030, partial [Planctomycetaceae bacterium]|nr:hypothetical protein [Planctomycetaceae bacterium]